MKSRAVSVWTGIASVFGVVLTLAFGLFAFLGMPLLCIGLGLLSAAVEDIDGG